MEESLFMDDIRTFFAMLDRMIYSLISIFYNTITDLATVQIIDTNTINGLTGKVYALLGIFMIFKVSFSLINYIVDPDKLADKAKGGGALIKNIAITIVLIITVPFAFDLLYEAQSAILTDQIIPKFIFNSESADVDSVKNSTTYQINLDPDVCASPAETTNMGDYIGLLIFNPFFVQETENVNENKSLANNESLRGYYCNSSSVKILLGNSDLYNAPKGWSTKYNYSIDYSFLLSTSIGVVVALLFLGFCFDVAVRMLKLFLLEIIAPIPIISYIDPDSSKNGMFKKWLKEVFNTWLSLFLRLGAVFLAVFVIQSIVASSNNLDEYSHPLWLRILIIIGTLIFAKQLPKMLEDILGIKMSGKFTLNPLKKLDNEALGFKEARVLAGKAAVGTGALGLSVAGSVIGHNRAKKKFAGDNYKLDSDFQKKLREMRNKKTNGEITAAQWREQMLNEKANYKEKKDKLNDDYNKFSNNHPIASGLAAAGRSAAAGFSKGAKSFTEALQNATSAATQAAKIRNKNDDLNLSARIDDFLTDIGGVKNSSGTTSEIKKQIKDVTESLNDINNNISSLNYAIGDVQRTAPGAIAYDSSGKMMVNSSYAWTNPNQKAQLQYTIDSYNQLRDIQKTRQGELNKLNDIISNPNGN